MPNRIPLLHWQSYESKAKAVRRVLTTLLVFWVAACAAQGVTASELDASNRLRGRVSYVTDGDTLWITALEPTAKQGSNPVRIKVRILDIDAPEICQEGGQDARQALMHKVLRKSIEIESRAPEDSYGRKLSPVYLEGEDIGAWMVSQGFAWVYHRPWFDNYYRLQKQAQKQSLGLWLNPRAIKPDAFRRQHGSCYSE